MVTRWFLIALGAAGAIVALWLTTVAVTVLTSTTSARAESLAEEGHRGAALLATQLSRREPILQSVLLVRMILEFAVACLALLAVSSLGSWRYLPLFVIVVPVLHLLGVVLARMWVNHAPLKAVALGPYVVVAIRRIWPIRFVSALARRLAVAVIPGQDAREPDVVDLTLIEEAFTVGSAEPAAAAEGRELVHSVAEFGQTVVREIMIPRTDMATLDASLTIGDALAVQAGHGWSRYPIEGSGMDDIVGVVRARDLMEAALRGLAGEPMSQVQRPVRFVPESKRVAALLRDMQRDKFHLAVVVDEYGGTAGLVTLEDILEELVGDIVDETDEEPPTLEWLADGNIRLAGALLVEEANEKLSEALPEGDWDTVGGLVTHHFGRVPRPGQVAVFERCEVEVERVTGRRVAAVIVRLTTAEPNRHVDSVPS